MAPILDPAEEEHITWATPHPIPSQQAWPLGPMKWVPGKNGTLVALAVGSSGGVERRDIVATLHPNSDDKRAALEQLEKLSLEGEMVVEKSTGNGHA